MTHREQIIDVIEKSLRQAEACKRVVEQSARIYGAQSVAAEHMFWTAKVEKLRAKLEEMKVPV